MRLKSNRPMPSSSHVGVRRRDLDDLEAALGAQDLERLRRVAGRHDGLEEARADGPRRALVDDPVGADDPAVGADAVALERQAERLGQVDHAGQAARVAVLDDAHRRRLEVAGDAPRRVEVEQVVEREVLAGDLVGGADAAAGVRRIGVEGAELVRVLAVAQVGLLLDHHRQAGREDGARGGVQVARDLRVVGRRQREGLGRQLLARLRAHAAQRLDVAQDRCVLGRAGDRRHAGEVLRRRPQQRHAADVDLLQRLVEAGVRLAHRLREGVEVDDHEVDLLDAVLGQLGEVVGLVATGEEPGEDLRVERLDPAAEDLVRLGQVADGPDAVDARIGEVGAGAVGGEGLDAGIGQAAGKLDDAFAVTDGEKGAQSTSSCL